MLAGTLLSTDELRFLFDCPLELYCLLLSLFLLEFPLDLVF